MIKQLFEELKVYPNPAVDKAVIAVKWHQNDLSIRLMDIQGRLVKEDKLSRGATTLEINTSPFSAGLYTLVIADYEGNSQQLKLAIKH